MNVLIFITLAGFGFIEPEIWVIDMTTGDVYIPNNSSIEVKL